LFRPILNKISRHVGKQIYPCSLHFGSVLQNLMCPGRVDPKHNPIVQEYVLPDLSTNRKGCIRSPDDIITETDQILVMNNERFTVPELLFRPDDIGRCTIFPLAHSFGFSQ
jgi:hypothetical protein